MRAAHGRTKEVFEHFREPDRAFDEVMRLNDGGVAYLASALEQVCKPGMKQAQARNRMNDLKKRMFGVLAPHYVATDSEQRVAERRAVADSVMDDFEECIARQAFGTFLRGICVVRGDLVEAFYEARLSGALSEGKAELQLEAQPAAPTQGKGWLRQIVQRTGEPAQQSLPQSGPPAPPRPRAARNEGLARTAMQLWSKSVHGACEDLTFAEATSVPPRALKEIATEIFATARRKGLEASLRAAIAEATHIETTEQASAKATIVAERLINRFVSTLGVDQPARETSFEASGIGDQPADFRQDFFLGWLKSFYDQTVANALSSDGLILDPEENAKLGEILKGLSA
ncbi:MAG TPA: virulence factor SrfC family protein [Methylocystis sp.]|nr:virulence factor SrfC family protein [Methylocystis sp.]